MAKKGRLVQGVGVNDSGYPVYRTSVIGGKTKILWTCPFYRTWLDMINRCYNPRVHVRQPAYAGCSVDPAWHSFSDFRAWMAGQDWEGNQLDKDILIQGNKFYSPETCVFVSAQINSFFIDMRSVRGEWPAGVCWDSGAGKLTARCSNPFKGKHEYLGLFIHENDAHEAWRQRKHEHACRYAEQQTDPRIAQALRTRYAKKPEGENA